MGWDGMDSDWDWDWDSWHRWASDKCVWSYRHCLICFQRKNPTRQALFWKCQPTYGVYQAVVMGSSLINITGLRPLIWSLNIKQVTCVYHHIQLPFNFPQKVHKNSDGEIRTFGSVLSWCQWWYALSSAAHYAYLQDPSVLLIFDHPCQEH